MFFHMKDGRMWFSSVKNWTSLIFMQPDFRIYRIPSCKIHRKVKIVFTISFQAFWRWSSQFYPAWSTIITKQALFCSRLHHLNVILNVIQGMLLNYCKIYVWGQCGAEFQLHHKHLRIVLCSSQRSRKSELLSHRMM